MILGHHYRFLAKTDTDSSPEPTLILGHHCRFFEPTVIGCKKNFITFSYDVRWRRTLYQIVVLKEIYNFVVQTFLIWDRLDVQIFSFENYVWFLNFKIWIFQMASDGETPKTKVIDLEKSCNFLVENFLFEIIYYIKIQFKIKIWNYWRTLISLFNPWVKLVTSLSPLY